VNQRYTISIIQSHHTILNEISFHSDCLFVFFVFFYSFRSVFFLLLEPNYVQVVFVLSLLLLDISLLTG
jgi:hypothetical protein